MKKVTITTSGSGTINAKVLATIGSAQFQGRRWKNKRTDFSISEEDFEKHKAFIKRHRITKARNQ